MDNLYFKKLRFIYLVVTFLIISISSAAQSWQYLGPEEIDGSASAEYTNVAVAPDGTVYMSYRDLGNSNKITVKKYSNSSLTIVGAAGFSAGGTYYTDIAVDKFNTPYVAYMDAANSHKATVKKYTNGNWVTVGSDGFSISTAGYINITTSPVGGIPYVAYQDAGNASKITVKKFDGSAWVNLGNAGFSTGIANSVNLVLASDGTPYVIYQDESKDFRAVVKKYDGSSWINVGSDGLVSTGYADYTDIAISANGIPYIIYIDESGIANIKKYASGIWSNLLGPLPSMASNSSITIGTDGNPFINYRTGTGLVTYKYTGSTWSPYSNTFSGTTNYSEIALASDGYPVITFATANKPYLMKYSSSSSFSELTNASISSSYKTLYNNLAIGTDGTPYISYFDNSSYLSYIKKFNNGSWNSVGNSFSIDHNYIDIAFSSNGIPHIIYPFNYTLNVKRYIGSSWLPLGTISGSYYSSIDNRGSIGLEFDASNTPYILYPSASGILVVKKHSGGVWQDVGSSVATNNSYNGIGKLKIASDGTPYVAYNESGISKAIVKKFDGSSWVNVGTPNVLSTPYTSTPIIEIAFGGGNIPYILFNESSTYYLRKYISNTWVTVATLSNVSSTTNPVKLAISTDGIPYVAYIENSTSKLALKKHYNGAWSNVGNTPYLSTSTTSDPALEIDAAGNIFTAYTVANGNYVKTFGDYTVLPVKLKDFFAQASLNDQVLINWSTAFEDNNSYFLLEHSIDGENFKALTKIQSKGSNSSYQHTDNNALSGTNYYRLTQFDKDGQSIVLGIRAVDISLKTFSNLIYPNPLTSTDFQIKLGSTPKDIIRVEVLDQFGRTIATRFQKAESNTLSIQLPYKPSAGIYLVKVEGQQTLKLFVK